MIKTIDMQGAVLLLVERRIYKEEHFNMYWEASTNNLGGYHNIILHHCVFYYILLPTKHPTGSHQH